MILTDGLKKIVDILNNEEIDYMIVGGFAVNYYNRVRFTADIDIIVQIYPHHIEKIVQHFPDWMPFLSSFKESAERGIVFNLTDYETGVKYDFMTFQVTEYNWYAFERRQKVDYLGIECFIAAPEDLIISKLQCYNISKSEKQWGDLNYLINLEDLNMYYLEGWINKLLINYHGLF